MSRTAIDLSWLSVSVFNLQNVIDAVLYLKDFANEGAYRIRRKHKPPEREITRWWISVSYLLEKHLVAQKRFFEKEIKIQKMQSSKDFTIVKRKLLPMVLEHSSVSHAIFYLQVIDFSMKVFSLDWYSIEYFFFIFHRKQPLENKILVFILVMLKLVARSRFRVSEPLVLRKEHIREGTLIR